METRSQQTGNYLKIEVERDVFLEARFLLYLPGDYDSLAEKKWPLVLFLHGAGESGEMLELVNKNGPPMMVRHGHQFPFILVSPQCPEDQRWSVEVLDMLLKNVTAKYRVDASRIYVTGLSMGGQGTWDLAMAYPERFAAIVPVCAHVDPKNAARIKDLPAWVFHGAKDDIVNISEAEIMVNTLKALGSPVKFTIYPEGNHDAWTDTYNNAEMWEWLLEQRR